MDRLAEANRWLSEAEWDFETAKILHEQGRFNASAFYSQQAAEKAVKAALYGVGEAPLAHSVRELLDRLREVTRVGVAKLMVSARELDRHYIPSRYPNAHPSGTPHEAYDEETARRALECAQAMMTFIKGFIEDLERKI